MCSPVGDKMAYSKTYSFEREREQRGKREKGKSMCSCERDPAIFSSAGSLHNFLQKPGLCQRQEDGISSVIK